MKKVVFITIINRYKNLFLKDTKNWPEFSRKNYDKHTILKFYFIKIKV